MPFKKPSEIKAETKATVQRVAAAVVEHQRAGSPVGRAQDARAAGECYLEVQLVVSTSAREVVPGSRDLGARDAVDAGPTLGQIEQLGWRLVHVNYVYVPTGESSRDKFLASGQYTAVSGETVGIYLFRNVDA